MLATPDPLTERATLMWHDHFATSQLKVDDVALMHRQNETFRRLGMGPFGALLRELLRDPALLAWLDAPSNRKGKTNENLARELMELFTPRRQPLHRGRRQGRRPRPDRPDGRPRRLQVPPPDDHDDAAITLLGQTGPLDGDGLVDLLLKQPAAAENLAARLCDTFLGEGVAQAEDRAALAASLRADDLHVGRGIALILRSEVFHSRRNQFTKVADPVGFGRRCRARAGAVRPAPEHAPARRVGRPPGAEPVLPPQRRRLAGRPIVADRAGPSSGGPTSPPRSPAASSTPTRGPPTSPR